MSQKIKIGAFFLVAVVVLFLGYKLRNRGEVVTPINSNNSSSENNGGNQGNTPGNEIGGLKPIFEDKILAFYVQGSDVWGVKENGQVIKRVDSKIDLVSSEDFAGVTKASFSYDGRRILLKVGDFYKFFNIDKSSWKDLPLMSSPSWAPKSHDLAYVYEEDFNSINVLSVDSLNLKPKLTIRVDFEDGITSWLDAGKLVISEKGASSFKSSAWSLDMQNKIWSPLVYEKQGVSAIWDGARKMGLVLTSQGRGGVLTLVNDRGESLNNLQILTLPSKCAFSENSLLCAIPKNPQILSSAFLPEAYEKGAITTEDYFVKISLDSGEITSKIEPSQPFDAQSLNLSGETVYFVNRIDGKLYSLSFKK